MKGDVMIALVPSHTTGGQGTLDLLKKGIKADMAIVGEPTDLGVLTMHAGVARVKVDIIGKTSQYAGDSGVNAIEKMGNYLRALGRSHETIDPGGWLTFQNKPIYEGLPRFNVGYIEGGLTRERLSSAPFMTPDFCTAVLVFRFLPSQSLESIINDMKRLGESMIKNDPTFSLEVGPHSETVMKPLETSADAPVVTALVRAYRKVMNKDPEVGGIRPFKFMGSDGGNLSSAGIPTVLFGPGEYTISPADEYVKVDQLVAAAKTYALAAFGVSSVDSQGLSDSASVRQN
jgi:acetylornithine deacetylase